MMPFCFKVQFIYTACYKGNKGNMAEELKKYKQILKREDEEFQEAMRAEVSTSLPSKLSR